MKASANFDWRPNWTDNVINSTPSEIMKALRECVFGSKIKLFSKLTYGSSWISRQFNITQRSAYSELNNIEKRIQQIANDAPRVLRIVKTKWDQYTARVNMQRDQLQREEIIKMARIGPAEFYLFLVTDHLNKSWSRASTGMEASSLSAWSKIGYDNQFLWSLKEFELIFF